MKRLFTILCIFFVNLIYAQVPAGYYDNAQGKTGKVLMEELYNTIKDHTEITYTDLWEAFYSTDIRTDGKVWDMYSMCNFTFGEDQDTGTGGTTECDVYNREHSFPRSWFGGAVSPMNTDIFHIYPTDKKVNAVRADYPYGTVANPSYTSSNGSKLGTSSISGYSGVVFEPANDYKGDFARSYFYMVTRYYNLVSSWNSDMLNNTQHPAFVSWALNVLLQWHYSDPVSLKEIERNNYIYASVQHNRNPFIDNPQYVQMVWSTSITPIEFTSNPAVTAFTGSEYSYELTTNQESTSSVSFVVLTKPQWLELIETAGIFSLTGTPGVSDIGLHYVVVLAKNSNSHTVQQFELEVKEAGSWINGTTNNNLTIYPNPASTTVTIGTGSFQNGLISIQNLFGAIVIQQQFTGGAGSSEIDLKDIGRGTYLVTLRTTDAVKVGMFIKQ